MEFNDDGYLTLSDDDEYFVVDKSDLTYVQNRVNKLRREGYLLLIQNHLSSERREAIHNIVDEFDEYSDIEVHDIGHGHNLGVIFVYRPKLDFDIDFFRLKKSAYYNFNRGNYERAKKEFETLIKYGRVRIANYLQYAHCLLRTHRTKGAIVFYTAATELSLANGGTCDYTEMINYLKGKNKDLEVKERIDMYENDFYESKTFDISMVFLDSLRKLMVFKNLSFEEAVRKLDLSDIEINYARLVYARDFYYLGDIYHGDKYFKDVEKSHYKNPEIKRIIEKMKIEKKYYPSRLDENKKQLVLKKY